MVDVAIKCTRCNQRCYGNVINKHGRYYHQYCFSCVVVGCSSDLATVGFFLLDDEIYCRDDYRKLLGITCAGCSKYIEGEAISALESTFHPNCFGCAGCGKVFPVGTEIFYDGDDFSCESCHLSGNLPPPISTKKPVATVPPQMERNINTSYTNSEISSQDNNKEDHIQDPYPYKEQDEEEEALPKCAGCARGIREDQGLLALDRQWHLWCFTCRKCGLLLTSEYMAKDGIPYCENDYQVRFGITCAGCGRYITGKVLQAGDKHYHPRCCTCAKCGELFGEEEDMYLQGNEIWHPSCSEKAKELQEHESDSMLSDESEKEEPTRAGDNETRSDNLSRASTIPEKEAGPARTTNAIEDRLSLNTKPIPYGQSPGFYPGKPPGFRAIKPPVPVQSRITKSTDNDDDEDEAPPIPPPPTRSSSSQWRLKYPASRCATSRKANDEPEYNIFPEYI